MALDVKVRIDLVKPLGKAGFGLPLILEENATTEKGYTECASLEEVVAAGFAEGTKTYKAANTIFMQENAPEKIAVCATSGDASAWLTDVSNVGKDWRQLIVVTNKAETPIAVSTIMAKVETLDNKLYFADLETGDTTEFTVNGINRTVLFYCDSTEEYPSPAAALVGATAGLPVGNITYKNMILKGIAAQGLTEAEITAIHAKGGITFVTKAGDNVTTEGKVAGGEYIDIIDAQDYIISNLEYQTQKALNTAKKIPFDNNGIAHLQSICENVLKDAYNNGIIASTEDGAADYTVNYALRDQVSDSDRVARKYVGGQFSFRLSGAIHNVEVVGEILI